MARPKRVSVKGKGADLFFADLQPASDSAPEPTGDSETVDAADQTVLATAYGENRQRQRTGLPKQSKKASMQALSIPASQSRMS